LVGKYVTLRPLAITDALALYTTLCNPTDANLWTYIPSGHLFPDLPSFTTYIQTLLEVSANGDLAFSIFIPKTNRIAGIIMLIASVPAHRRIEVGHVLYSRKLQHTSASTEAVYLLVRYAFEELGNERVEWKCDRLNAPSFAAAGRLGFRFEGTFLKHMVVKGHRRDTAWLSIIDEEWTTYVKEALTKWLHVDNFDDQGKQKRRLEDIRREIQLREKK
ncbi:acetyltransferase, partial [Amylocarpus encephaloides]